MNAATCPLVAAEQLPATTACVPAARAGAVAAPGVRPQFAGRPMATPEPAVTSGMSFSAGPSTSRSSLDTASTMAISTPSARSAAMRSRIAAPRATTAWSIRPTLRRVCAASTRSRFDPSWA